MLVYGGKRPSTVVLPTLPNLKNLCIEQYMQFPSSCTILCPTIEAKCNPEHQFPKLESLRFDGVTCYDLGEECYDITLTEMLLDGLFPVTETKRTYGFTISLLFDGSDYNASVRELQQMGQKDETHLFFYELVDNKCHCLPPSRVHWSPARGSNSVQYTLTLFEKLMHQFPMFQQTLQDRIKQHSPIQQYEKATCTIGNCHQDHF